MEGVKGVFGILLFCLCSVTVYGICLLTRSIYKLCQFWVRVSGTDDFLLTCVYYTCVCSSGGVAETFTLKTVTVNENARILSAFENRLRAGFV